MPTTSTPVTRLGLLAALALVVGTATGARAFHTQFDFTVDRFEVDGNAFGPADGVPDHVDDFTDSTLGAFTAYFGSPTPHTDGLHLRSPGTHYTLGPFPVLLDMSAVRSSMPVTDGAGNFTATAVWAPTTVPTNNYFYLTLFAFGSTLEVAGIGIDNFDPTVAAQFSPNQPPGLSITQHRAHATFLSWDPPELSTVTIDPSELTGAILFRLSFDDRTNMLSTAFSLDGGQTWRTPFPPMPFFTSSTAASFLLGADPGSLKPGPPPPPPPAPNICPGAAALHGELTARKLDHVTGSQALTFAGTVGLALVPAFDPIHDPLQLLLQDDATPDAPLFDATGGVAVPPGGPGTGCDPRDGWKVHGAVAGYRNRSNALPPLCTPGSAQGIQAVRLKNRATDVAVAVRTKGSPVVAPSGVTYPLTLVFGASPAAIDAARCGRGSFHGCRFSRGSMRCRDVL